MKIIKKIHAGFQTLFDLSPKKIFAFEGRKMRR
jgi:hypothetical protein